jgi:hypothetical protein
MLLGPDEKFLTTRLPFALPSTPGIARRRGRRSVRRRTALSIRFIGAFYLTPCRLGRIIVVDGLAIFVV